MRPLEIEQWVLRIVDQVAQTGHSEDSFVELKAKWPTPIDAARRIAAHANSARGADILWIIGIDEENGVCGADKNELSDWFAAVRKQFDDGAPEMIDLNVSVNGMTVVAMIFKTDRAPFVVRNPTYGKAGGGSVEREIPWREGRSTRSATRQDLLRLITPLVSLPDIECLKISIRVVNEWTEKFTQVRTWYVDGSLYIAPKPGAPVTIPRHRVHIHAGREEQQDEFKFGNISLYVHDMSPQNPVTANHSGVTARHPGLVFFSCSRTTSTEVQAYPSELLCTLRLPVVDALIAPHIQVRLLPHDLGNEEAAHWIFESDA